MSKGFRQNIKEHLSKSPVLDPPEPLRPLQLYLSVLDGAFGCVMGQHDETGRKENAIYYLSLIKRFLEIEFKHVLRIQNEFADALATLSSMIQHPDKNFIDPILIEIHKKPTYCAHVEEEFDRKPWFYDIMEYLEKGEYPKNATLTQKRTLPRLANLFFQRRGILYRRTPELGLLRCIDAKEASRFLKEIHIGTCRPHMNGFIMAKKILRAGSATNAKYMLIRFRWHPTNSIQRVHPVLSLPGTWMSLDKLNPLLHTDIDIDYFTKCIEDASYKALTKKVVADFVRDCIVCRFGVPESIITDNAANINSDLM
ncbi:uncharacterized protein [Nicotiana tomentosiformis]|uniref:uncharacterized protein n=1 Tax=Nicotiana tomentosiformis TaxID=4098 RepID=UPI00388C5952